MEKLPNRFAKKGFQYIKVEEDASGFIYEKRCNGEFISFEVFAKRIQKSWTTPTGKEYPAKIRFPNDEAFGVWAWDVKTKEKASFYLEVLRNKQFK